MDSKYNLIGNKTNTNSFFNRKKPAVQISKNNGASKPKKIKFGNNQENSCPKVNNNKNGNKNVNKYSLQEHRERLPIFGNKNKLVELIKQYSTLIVLAETGSGKTTQIPQYLLAAKLDRNKKIAVTQPRRVAAVSVAMRVAKEVGDGLVVGETVGYSVRFEDVTSNKTKIKYMTDGMLLREAIYDKMLLQYSIIILDEAHERSVHTDVLFGIVKDVQKIRKDRSLPLLKIIIMSATMDVDHFSRYFDNCQVVYLEGRTFPVNLFYSVKPYDDYQTACVATFFKIHQEAPADHGVLIFLTGQEEIESVCNQIRTLAKDPEVHGPPVRVFALYASQPSNQQMLVFNQFPPNIRKVIVSTNVAETSVTISGVKYVIDSGRVKIRTFHPQTGLEMLKVQRISKEQAWQRTGRAGRESEGFCYRIYTKNEFDAMQEKTIPEIQRANLSTIVLQLLAIGINAATFDFMDKPQAEAIQTAFEQLKILGAIEEDMKTLTSLGRKMSKFPLDPRFSKILLSAHKFGCIEEALTIVSVLSSESIYINPPSKRQEAASVREKFKSPYGDHITMLNVFREFTNVGQSNRKSWCVEHYINLRNMLHVREVRGQLSDILCRNPTSLSSCGSNMDQIRKCLLTGLFTNVAELFRNKQYITVSFDL